MFDPANPAPYLIVLLIGVLAYFLKDAHSTIKIGLEKRATQEALDKATDAWRKDLVGMEARHQQMEERHQRETARLEHQYEQKFAGVVQQFQDRMSSVEKNLQDRMDLILEVLKQRP